MFSRTFHLAAVLLFGLLASGHAFRNTFRKPVPLRPNVDYGDPLYLTPYLDSDADRETARGMALVDSDLLGISNVTSYAGYFNVNPDYNSQMFFWYFEAQENPADAPVVLWLQGGPGSSSMFALFVENGPFKVTINLDLEPNEYAWTIPFNVIYIDQPVGTGFSFTDDDAGYANNQTDVATDLYSCLQQFFTLFDDLRDNEFYVTGESYGGKYVPSIAYKIYEENLQGSENINLQGIAVGDGLFEVEAFLHYGDFLYQVGLIDEIALAYFHEQEALTAEYIRSSDWQDAFNTFAGFILCGGEGCYYTEQTGLNTYYNYLRTNEPYNQDYYELYLALPRVRRAIHTGNNTYSDGDEEVYDHLEQDIPKSVRDWLSTVMDNYRVMIYSGQVDVIVAAPLTENFLTTLAWSGAEQYANTPHTIWRVESSDSEVAGYVRQVGEFYQVTVRNAGHMVPYDQPRVAYSMITNFVFNTTFTD